jgi:hypothetical protein
MDETVKFIKNYSPYAKGDIAGFDEKQANWLEKAGVIEKVEEGGKDATDNNSKGKKLSSGNK